MAAFYVDPTAATNGSGTFNSPFNVWTSAWTAATAGSTDVLLQKQGTTFTGTIGFTKNGLDADNPITVGVYDAATGNRITGTIGAAKINGNMGSIGMNMQDRYYVLVDGFEVYNCLNYALYEGHSAGTLDQKADYVTSMQFKNLYIHHIYAYDLAAIWIQGSGVKYNNILIEDCAGDGISQSGACIGEDITVQRINNTSGGLGDCIQQQYVRPNTIWRRCLLDHSNNSQKQAIVIGTGVLISATGTVIEDCEFLGDAEGAGLVSVNFVTGVTIRRNKFRGDKGVYVLGSTSIVDADSNIIIGKGGNTIGIGGATGSTINARHNTIVDHQRGIELLGVNGTAKNNIVSSTGATPISATTKATNYTNLDGDPQLNGDFKPAAAGVLNTGTYLGGLDFNGKEFSLTPNIGAVQVFSTRTATTRSVTSRSTARRSIGRRAT